MFQRIVALIGLCIAWPAAAIEFDLGPVSGVLNTRLTLGAQMRVQKRDERLIAKLALPGQQDLCAPDDCVSALGDPEPNQRLVNARGAFSGVNEDNGNLNYDRGDLSAVLVQLRPRLDLFWGEWQFQASALFFHDLVNAGFEERHADTRFQPARSPRNAGVESLFASGVRVGNLLVTRSFALGREELLIKIGNQTLNWGEANLVQFNALSEINPLDAPVFGFPGAEISQNQLHMPLAVASLSLGTGVTAELHYHLQWRAAKLPASGSLLSFNDVAGGGRYAMLGLGNFNEDPHQQFRPAGLAAQISQSQRTLFIPGQGFGAARDSGQFGLRLSYLADWLNNGTELSLHALNYHSRVPVLSVFAAEASCIRDAGAPGFLAALVACEGFNGPMNPQGREPLPVDTVQPFLDYVEDIRLFGLSFNTNVGDWALSGEIAHRPNHPLQILQTDVLFAGLGPAFPAEDLRVGAPSLADAVSLSTLPEPLQASVSALREALAALPAGTLFTLPGEDSAVPDQLSAYRGISIAPGQLVRGFERLQTSQLTLTAARVIGPNPLGAAQILFAVEAAALQVHDLPGRDRLTLEGAGDRTHPSPGADGSGSPDGQPDTRRINPTQMTGGFGDALSYGYRVLARLTYSDLPGRMTLNPTFVFLHDLEGISPAPVINFIEGRRILLASLQADFLEDWSAGLTYQVFTGGGTRHRLRDRDNVSAFLAYTF
jgi:hypothetical protein